MLLIDQLSYSSKLRYKNPYVKAFFSVCTLMLCVITRSIIVSMITFLVMGSLTIIKGGTSFSHYNKLIKIPMVFIFLSTISIIVNISKVPLSSVGFPVFGYYISISSDSCFFSARLFLTALSSVSCLYFLSLTTPMTDLLMVLDRLHFPPVLIELMMLIYRFIFILMEIANSLTISMKSRLGYKDFKTSCYSVGSLMAVLLLRSMQKASYLYDAMESRCYNGRINLLTNSYPITKKEIVFVGLFELMLLFIYIFLKVKQINL